ncbi:MULTISPECIES: HEAT repeat domain-containing protein [unclassified Microcoleus]|uniref:NACHT domain-containing protein n=1 Tax=unclassified Microcoleus TaxID=2642155 RepID=UPI001D6D940A|nr:MULTISPECIES: HEAT repeat domain-containing protein [unclassified Microcoleus]MCC3444527.1 HEAT repeat domain-containing protein [Microcoleus sp. PH2017_03_ELD_O_A]MCC3467835.1 HEAT repeat domain-containing protein [Microcoleus sp. PH2017_06_SFM_O_A]MCC3506668.1 HEAT repeat domain-containing protein [Microcoleus sp. PH2017_19_SFW_U_A]MCC3557085.1 HEAT repeat domain-containing protein [Microcoleus sp. PH2017_35_SFW_U_B]MCC3565939.1 HEAT repeat domain-containing protein [Microcoleus sp. PH201
MVDPVTSLDPKITNKLSNDSSVSVSIEKPVFDFINEYQKLLILGEAGSGKTTVLLELLRRECGLILDYQAFSSIPVYVPLSLLSQKNDILELLDASLSQNGLSVPNSILCKMLSNGHFTVLLDGINEIPLFLRESGVERNILTFIHKYPKNKYYLTSRIHDFRTKIKKEISSITIQCLTAKKQIVFVQNYLDKKDTNRFFEITGFNLKSDFQSTNSPINILRNPLLLWMTIQIFKQTKERTYLSKGGIFKKFVDHVFQDREDCRPNKYCIQLKIQLLASLAFEMLKDGYIVTATYDFVMFIFATYAKSHNQNTENIKYSSQEILEEILLHGFLRQVTSQKIEWNHQAFQEYFAAVKLTQIFDSGGNISPQISNNEWKEVIIIAADIVKEPEKFIKNIMYGWLGITGIFTMPGQRDVLARAAMLASEERYSKEFRQQVIENNHRLNKNLQQRFVDLCETDLFIGNRLIILIGKYLIQLDKFENIKAFGIWLVGISKNTEMASELLIHLQDRRCNIRWITAKSLKLLKSCEAVDALIHCLRDTDGDVRWICMRALADIGDKRAVMPLVAFLDHEHPVTRAAAVWALSDIGASEALSALEEAKQKPANAVMLWWGQALDEAIESAIVHIKTKNTINSFSYYLLFSLSYLG